jgi:hypothetical protein
MWLSKTPSHWNPIWRTSPIPLRFSTNKTESPATRLVGSTRSNGTNTPKVKPRGNVRTFYEPTTPTSFHQGNPRSLLSLHSISGRDFLQGGRAVTPRVTKTLKKVINKWLGAVTRLNQKTHFKNKVSDSNYREINPNFFFKWNSKFWSFFGKNLFSLQ